MNSGLKKKDNPTPKTIPQTAELLCLGVAILTVALIGVRSYRDWLALGRVNQQRDLSQQIVQSTTNLLSTLKDAETGQRGYLLTGRESYLAPYQQAVTDVPRILSTLTGLMSARPDQTRRVTAMEPLVREKLDELRQTIEVFRLKGPRPALEIVNTDRGKAVMDQIRQTCAEIEAVATDRYAQQSENARASENRTRIASAAGSILLLALLTLTTITIRNGARRRQELVEALQKSEEQTRLIVETALDAVIKIDGNGIIAGWNPQAEADFGWTRQEAIGRSFHETILAARDRADVLGLERLVAPETSVLRKRIEITALHRDGREFPAELALTPVQSGENHFFSAFMRDISKRKRAREKIQAQLDRLNLLDQITRAIGERQDLHSVFQVAVRSLEESLPLDFACVCLYEEGAGMLTVTCVGVHSQALAMELAMPEQARISIDQNGLAKCVRGQLIYEPDVSRSEYPFPQRLARGGLRSLVATPLMGENGVFGILVAARREANSFSSGDCEFLRQLNGHVALAAHQARIYAALQQAYDDLRQSQQAVMQQERLRALGQMASGIAHDINNALSPVSLYTESLLEQEPNLSPRTRECLNITQRALADVAHTVTRMEEFYRQRPAQLTLQPVGVNRLIPQILDLTRARWSDMPLQQGKVIRVRTELAPDLPAIAGIESEIREALVNLIFNAVDAMPEGGTLTLRTCAARGHMAPKSVSSGFVHIEIKDTGIGMDEETRRRCLEPFFTTKGERGTGLGLAMVFGIIRRHNAEVEIESAAGEGTLVRLSFPIAQSGVGTAQPAPAHAAPMRLRILIVDDDPLIIKSLRDTLEADGHAITSAGSGQEGVEVFQAAQTGSERFDLVITDLGMPRIDGRQVASAIKAVRSSTPVILLTGWGQRLMADGDVPPYVDRVLNKPPKLHELRAALVELTAITRQAGSG